MAEYTVIDTVNIEIMGLSRDAIGCIKERFQYRSGVNGFTGEIEYSFGQYNHAWLSGGTIKYTLKHDKWLVKKGKRYPVREEVEPYMLVEGSPHKLMLGHNVYGGPTNFNRTMNWLHHAICEDLDYSIPTIEQWRMRRIDWAIACDLGSEEVVKSWFEMRKQKQYPRRTVHYYGNIGLMASGSSTCLRAYAKGEHFMKSGDYTSLKRAYKIQEIPGAQEIAANSKQILRCEVEIKKDLLDRWIEGGPFATDIDESMLREAFDKDWLRFLRVDAEDSDNLARMSCAVEERLFECYSAEVAIKLWGYWYILATRGEERLRMRLPNRTQWYRVRKLLESAHVSWIGTDVLLKDGESEVPSLATDFVPSTTSQYNINYIDPRIEECYSQYKVSA